MKATKKYILDLASKKKRITTLEVVKNLNQQYSRQYISSAIRDLVREGVLVKIGATNGAYYVHFKHLSEVGNKITRKFKNKNLLNKEDQIYNKLIEATPTLVGNLNENISSILFYAFTEMLNNAIEHSFSKYIEVQISKSDKDLSFVVNDYGVGVFRSVIKKKGLKSEIEAIQDLLKGKTTTQPRAHSGEGIFFTSKVGDVFILDSYGYKLRVDNNINDIFIEQPKNNKKGTKVSFVISLDSQKHLDDVFKNYYTGDGEVAFDKTEIRVKLYTMGTIYISRSQARRILAGIDKFKTVILDFDKVPTIGQAFADEVFRVFRHNHPEIRITPVNTVPTVQFMIDRVEKPAK